MNQITILLQNDIKSLMSSFANMQRECKDIYDAYFKTDATTNVSALSADSDPATVETKFTKLNYINGITFCENLIDFFTNDSPTQADYLQIVNQCRYGNATLATPLSVATEEIGKRIKQICLDALENYKQGQNVIEIYFDNEVGDIVAVLDDYRIIFGSEMTKSDLVLAITMLQEFVDMITNGTITSGDYSSTISKWERLTVLGN